MSDTVAATPYPLYMRDDDGGNRRGFTPSDAALVGLGHDGLSKQILERSIAETRADSLKASHHNTCETLENRVALAGIDAKIKEDGEKTRAMLTQLELSRKDATIAELRIQESSP